MAQHSEIGASGYSRWGKCPASVQLSRGIPSKSSKYAEAGTVAHDIAEKILKYKIFEQSKPLIPDGYPEKELEAIHTYTNWAWKTYRSESIKREHVKLETKLNLSQIHEGLFGTADLIMFAEESKNLFVCDYKHGSGVYVPIEDNKQLRYYALGALLNTDFKPATVTTVIIQPRYESSPPVRKEIFDVIELLDFAGQLELDAKATQVKNPLVKPGNHCRFCPAKEITCFEFRKAKLVEAKEQFSIWSDYE